MEIQRKRASLFVLAESLKIGFLNTLKETPGTYPSAGLCSQLLGAALGRGWALDAQPSRRSPSGHFPPA